MPREAAGETKKTGAREENPKRVDLRPPGDHNRGRLSTAPIASRPPWSRGMSTAGDEFAALVAQARAGDTEAVARLARLYEPEVRIFARVHLGPALQPYLDSMDLVQSVHRSLLVGLRLHKFSLEGPENLLALALTMVRRKIARHWRKHRRQQRQDEQAETLPELLTALSGAEPPRVAQRHDALRKLCEQLSEQERRIVELRLEGHTTAAAARELGLNADVLRVLLSRLRRRLREAGVLEELL
jgi:RNA polymerase sigma-70 factor (ECF subfamily)